MESRFDDEASAIVGTGGQPLGRTGRFTALLLASFCLVGFGLASWLQPDPRGYGTHQQLGLPECSFRIMFGVPCPGCGMTTSFAYFVRGQWRLSAQANPAGLLLAMACAGLIPWLLLSAATSRLWWVNDPLTVLAVLMASVSGVGLIVWLLRIWS